jgi:hypothetical protein
VLRLLRVLIQVAAVGVIVVVVLVAPVRRAALRSLGGMLVVSDEPAPADVLATDVESSIPGLLALGDLHRAQPAATVALLRPAFRHVDEELAHHGVVLPDFALETLSQLGIPRNSVTQIPSGEGGTTDSTHALAAWARAHPRKRILVVVGPSHGRRYRRALLRAWPAGITAPLVVTTPYGLFRADDWWVSRTTLREGLVEIEKLALDYAAHPF